MKKILAALGAILLLTACGANETNIEPTPAPEVPAVEEPAEILPDILPEVTQELPCTTETVEGLVEDAVAYIYDYPVFGKEAIDGFYGELMSSLEAYAKQTVYTAAMERHTLADVTGTFDAAQTGDTVTVTYTVTVEFADGGSETFDRTDSFDRVSGMRIEE